ncbi:hypothetical protein FRX31_033300, partial [Thalictrum thalictroides]
HNTGKISGKLDERSTKCYLVGYESINIFRLFDPATRKVSRARDVIFQESIQPTIEEKESSTNVENSSEVHHEMNLPNLTISHDVHKSQYNSQSTRPVDESSQVERSQQYHTAQSFQQDDTDSSLDELVDPQYEDYAACYKDPFLPRAFVSKCLAAADSNNTFIPETLEQAMQCSQSKLWAA